MTHSPWPPEGSSPDDWAPEDWYDDAAPYERDAASPRGSGEGSTGRRGATRLLGAAILLAALAAAGGMFLISRLDNGQTTARAPGSPQTDVNILASTAAKAVGASGTFALAAAGSRLTDTAGLPASGGLEIDPGWVFDTTIDAQLRAHVAAGDLESPAGIPLPTRPPEVAMVVPLPRRNPLSDRNAAPPTGSQGAGSQVASVPAPDASPLPRREQVMTAARTDTAPADADTTPDGRVALPTPGTRYALYDIEAATVYLPSGERLEAHSGYGDNFDNSKRVHIRMLGPTPPNTYKLTMREALFHGVEALRLNPVGEGKMYGRTGLLTHSYLLGPRGDSNGCVSFKNYERFLAAYKRGEVSELVVVASSGHGKQPANSLLSWLIPPR